MMDPFKFAIYPVWAKVIIVIWALFSVFVLFGIPMFIKPTKSEANNTEPPVVVLKEKQEIKPTNKEPVKKTTPSRGYVITDSENIKVYGNTANGSDEGYVSERNKNIEFKDNKYTAPKK